MTLAHWQVLLGGKYNQIHSEWKIQRKRWRIHFCNMCTCKAYSYIKDSPNNIPCIILCICELLWSVATWILWPFALWKQRDIRVKEIVIKKNRSLKVVGETIWKTFYQVKHYVSIATASDSHVTNPELLHYHSQLQRRRSQRDWWWRR